MLDGEAAKRVLPKEKIAEALGYLRNHWDALRNDLDVYVSLKAVLDALLSGSTNYAALRPDQWAAAHPDAIREYRREERRDRYARKTARRAERRAAATGQS